MMPDPRQVFEEFARRFGESFGRPRRSPDKPPLRDMLKLPAPPFDKAPPILRTLVTVSGLVSVALLAGMGVAALALLVLCALLLLLILQHVLGIELSFDPNEVFF